MRVSLVRGGGIGGLVKVISVDSEKLTPEEAANLAALVQGAGPLQRNIAGSPHPEEFTYLLRVDQGKDTAEYGLSESSLTPDLQRLISWLGTVEHRTESIEPPGHGGA